MTFNPSQISSLVTIKQNDTARILYDTLTISGTPLNLTSGSVMLIWYDPVEGTATRKSGSVQVAESGSVSYQLTSDDVGTVGNFILEWEATLSSSTVLTVPTETYIKLKILPDLDV
jgi:hypothetical protein